MKKIFPSIYLGATLISCAAMIGLAIYGGTIGGLDVGFIIFGVIGALFIYPCIHWYKVMKRKTEAAPDRRK